MAYDNPGPAAGGNPGGETMSEGMHDESMPHQDEAFAPLYISPDMLPSGMKVNEGDILEFKVTKSKDGDGDIEVVYNTGEGKGEEEKEPSWEDDFREAMSPRSDEEPQVPGGGGGEGY